MRRFVFHYRNQPSRKQQAVLAAAIAGGARHGDAIVGVEGLDRVHGEADGAILFGIGGIAKSIYDAYRAAGKKTVLIDKGYTRNEHLRFAVNGFQPLAYLDRDHPADRLNALGIDLLPYDGRDRTHVLFDGASNKFAMWKGLAGGDYHAWGTAVVARIRAHTDLPVIYRPRPTHNDDLPVAGAEHSRAPLEQDLARALVVVSYGGNIGWDAAVAGIAHFALGDSIARPISETDWTKIGAPKIPADYERWQWASDVAYQQWTMDEIERGEAWDHVRGVLDCEVTE